MHKTLRAILVCTAIATVISTFLIAHFYPGTFVPFIIFLFRLAVCDVIVAIAVFIILGIIGRQ